MKYTKIVFKNIGPIESGEIRRKKVSVFFGPNNSGKSVAASLVHGVCQLDTTKSSTRMQKALDNLCTSAKIKKDVIKYMQGRMILHRAGILPWRITTVNKKSCMLEMRSSKKPTLAMDFLHPKVDRRRLMAFASVSKALNRQNGASFYMPAGRTGIIQEFMHITKARNALLQQSLDAYLHASGGVGGKRSEKYKLPINMPERLERLLDLMMPEKIDEYVQDMFTAVFQGTVSIDTSGIIPRIMYTDPSGFKTEIERAGSGTLSSLPIMMSIGEVDDGGTLIIEEPEAHLEPKRQMKLVEELVAVAKHKKINLIFSTHSDYVVKKLQAMTVSKKIKQSDLGLYYFKRMPGAFTNIEEVPVDEDGEIQQDMFDDAIDALVEEVTG